MSLLFDLDAPDAGDAWRIVNDDVMGGRSSSRFRIEAGVLRFEGVLSLANNGGFASVRSSLVPMALRAGDALQLRICGDGRTFIVQLFVPTRMVAFSFRHALPTPAGEWSEVIVPLSAFEASHFGRSVPGVLLDPTEVVGLGFMLADKQPGPFRLDIRSIRIHTPDGSS